MRVKGGITQLSKDLKNPLIEIYTQPSLRNLELPSPKLARKVSALKYTA